MKHNLAQNAWPSRRILLLTIFVLISAVGWLVFTANNLLHQLKIANLQLAQAKETSLLEKMLIEKSGADRPGNVASSLRAASTYNTASSAAPTKLLSMEQIGGKTGTDKVTHHRYHRYYPRFVEEFRTKPSMKMLEIGFLLGQSYEMWKEYFPNGKVYFLDINRAKSFPEARFVGDSGKVEDLARLLEEKNVKNDLDFIIDDGSHSPVHQITAFQYLFVHGLKPGGVYIIEDIETSYWQSGECYGYAMHYGRDHPDALVTRTKTLVDVVNRKFSLPTHPYSSTFGPEVDKWVSGIFFGTNTIVITKTKEDEYDFDNESNYPLKENLKKEADRLVPMSKPKNAPPGLKNE
jgi:hypothetical protein